MIDSLHSPKGRLYLKRGLRVQFRLQIRHRDRVLASKENVT